MSDSGQTLGDGLGRATASVQVSGPLTLGIREPVPGHPEFHRILAEIGAMHAKKATDYGRGADPLANIRGTAEWGIPAWLGVFVRMGDKMHRLKSFAVKRELANESVEDSLLDLAAYAIIALVLYREERKS